MKRACRGWRAPDADVIQRHSCVTLVDSHRRRGEEGRRSTGPRPVDSQRGGEPGARAPPPPPWLLSRTAAVHSPCHQILAASTIARYMVCRCVVISASPGIARKCRRAGGGRRGEGESERDSEGCVCVVVWVKREKAERIVRLLRPPSRTTEKVTWPSPCAKIRAL